MSSRGSHQWVVLFAATLIVGMGLGSLFSIAVFLKPVAAEFGWPRGQTAFAYSSAAFLQGLSGIMMGTLADRFSARPVVLFGALMTGGSLVLLGFVQSLWQLYLLYGVCLGALGLAGFLTPLVANIGHWFDRSPGLALGILMAGQSLGGAIIPALARYLIATYGWREAYIILGITAWAVTLPLALLIGERPGIAEAKRLSRAAEKTPGQARALIVPWKLTAVLCPAIVMCCICMSIPLVHVVALVTDVGISGPTAAGIFSAMLLTSIVGRVGIGKLADYIGGIRALLLASAGQTVMIFWFSQMTAPAGFYLIAVLFGLGYGGVIPAYAIIIREYFTLHRVGMTVGLVFFFGNLGMGLGGFLGGFLFDLSGTYTLSYATGAATGTVNLLIVGSLLYFLSTQRPALVAPEAA